MDDGAAVGGSETGDELECDIGRALQAERPTLDRRPQRLAVEQLCDQVRLVARADVEDGENVGMRPRGDGARFLFESLQPRRVGGERRRQDY